MNKSKIKALIEKARAGEQITAEELEALAAPRNPDARPAKVCSPKNALNKARKGVELTKWELEDLAKSPEHAVQYAEFKGERFPECERHLLEDGNPGRIKQYFINIVGERNEALERHMLKSGTNLVQEYCSEVLKSRWIEGERLLLEQENRWHGGLDADGALDYQAEHIKGPWAELEKILTNGKQEVADRNDALKKYFKNCGRGSHEETERRLLKSGTAQSIYLYARLCLGGKLPESLHNKMILKGSKASKKYLNWLESRRKSTVAYLKTLESGEREELVSTIPETIQTLR